MKPKVWLTGSKAGSTFLIKHPADCGYTVGTGPKAKILPNEIDFSYEMSNDSGALAACYCEYWAKFSLKSTPPKISKITINGDEAELMSDLKQR